MYPKPLLSYYDQLELLESRGLSVLDKERCLRNLRAIGYFRLSGYVYPFRALKPESERSSELNFRYDHMIPGYSLDEIIDLALFDRALRLRILEGIDIVETALKTLIAQNAGKHDRFIHEKQELLDKKECEKVVSIDGKSFSKFDLWISRYESLVQQAKNEDFIKHHYMKYGEELPIWIAMEVLDLGAVSRFFNLLPKSLKSYIGKELGISNGRNLDGYLKSINYVRNKCAHFSRIWNRTLTYKVARPNKNTVEVSLHHLADLDGEHLSKIYPVLALLAYMISFVDPESRWRFHLVDTLNKMPNVQGTSPEESMGFPAGWKTLPMWDYKTKYLNGQAFG